MHHFRRVGSGLVCRSPARKVLRVSLAYDNSAEEAICPKLRWHSDHSHEELPPRFLPSPVAPRSVRRKGALHLKGPFHLWPWVVAQGFPPFPLLPAITRILASQPQTWPMTWTGRSVSDVFLTVQY